jgi:hypothetical protein
MGKVVRSAEIEKKTSKGNPVNPKPGAFYAAFTETLTGIANK